MKKEILIGLSVIIALLILFFGINYLKGINLFKASNYYYASYTNVAGLSQSAPVTVNGFKVGLVREIAYEYDNPGHVRVELSLDSKLRVPEGSKAILVTDMLGTAAIELKMAQSDKYYAVGDKLPSGNAAGLLDNVSSNVMPQLQAIIPKVDSLLSSAVTIASDPAIIASVKRLDAITANLERSTAQLSRTMTSMPAVASDASATMANARRISDDLGAVTAELRTLPIDSTFANVERLTLQLNDIMNRLRSDDNTMGLLLNDPSLYRNLNSSVAALDSLLVDVKRNPKRYISIKLL